MSNVMTNFRAKDMPGGGGSKSGVQRRPKPTQLPAEPVPQPTDDGRSTSLDAEQRGDTTLESPPQQSTEEVPAGTTAEILQWVGDDTERAQRALDAEQAHSSPRHGLTGELNKILSS